MRRQNLLFAKNMIGVFGCVFLLALSFAFIGCASVAATAEKVPDAPWYEQAPTHRKAKHTAKDFTRQSLYLIMPDGVRIAVDVYLPKNRKSGETFPTILAQTRYWRMMHLRPWVRPFLEMPPGEIKQIVSAGYALVRVDARGSGASFGSRSCPWSTDEVKDGAKIVDWIIQQPWSNKIVGAAGCSYEGTSSEFLLVNNHPNVKAVAPTYALFDAYTDIAFPGGNHLSSFTRRWQEGNNILDSNRPQDAVWYAKIATKGVSSVDDDPDRILLRQAIEDHKKNYQVHDESSLLTFRDDVSPNGLCVESFSPHHFASKLRSSKAAIYSYSGWYDGGYPHAAIKRYLTLGNKGSKLILGPWDHGGDDFVRPFDKPIKTGFDHTAELIRFFDYHLKGIENGIESETPIHYFTQVQNKWKSANTWPPKAQQYTFYFSHNHKLTPNRPDTLVGYDLYKVDLTASTGKRARWDCLVEDIAVQYNDRAAADTKLLVYQSSPLERDMEVTGHPLVQLFVDSDMEDGQFFVYLEDVDSVGRVGYVTEGMLRGIHRKLNDHKPEYKSPAPYRTFKREDAMPMVPGQTAQLTFDLLPVSYLFQKGHSIRVSIAGADKDHFSIINDTAPIWKIFRDSQHLSSITLPIIEAD